MAMTTIYHNPRCGTSRTVLQALQARGIETNIVEYLKTPLSRGELRDLIHNAGLSPREAIRSKEALFDELGLGDPDVNDDQLIDAMAEHPILMNRPFVVTGKGTRLCRPATVLEEIL
ncbi:arsenate reductase (glutaredoxin) [Pollutimonas subterranea]|uniref:Arsenate reductase n=2 Tax=Pollutimonas subterranea TaxID=2045210 RepID=A0A2N4U7R4_9BURK|nr:arsenate reductase (glutaredoxin) [Pollutimonas subterranea]PLC51064.1 arsenate reductase (glutaredoxin) [Pollutimonas subterranea]